MRTSTTVHDTSIDLRGLVALPWLHGATTVRVRVERIPDSGEVEVATLPLVDQRLVPIEGARQPCAWRYLPTKPLCSL